MGDYVDRRETKNTRKLYDCHTPPPSRDVYECPPPAPVVVECSICRTAENVGTNLWDCLPFIAFSSLVGPTLGVVTIHVLSLLPLSAISWLGIGHKKNCTAQDPVICDEHEYAHPTKINAANICPPYNNCNVCGEGGDELSTWMDCEYVKLARELADLERLTGECQGDEDDARCLHQARNYVLDRLAEMVAKRDEHEMRMKKKKPKCQ